MIVVSELFETHLSVLLTKFEKYIDWCWCSPKGVHLGKTMRLNLIRDEHVWPDFKLYSFFILLLQLFGSNHFHGKVFMRVNIDYLKHLSLASTSQFLDDLKGIVLSVCWCLVFHLMKKYGLRYEAIIDDIICLYQY